MSKKTQTIALFGGSFNPPHIGHYEIVKRVARRKTIDQVWVIPVYKHPFGKKLAPFSQRLRDCRKLLKPLGRKACVKDTERRLGGKSWTIRLITFLQKKKPTWQFYWVMGRDTYRQRHDWKDFAGIRKRVKFIVFPRGPRSPIPNVSSTEIRNSRQKPKK